MNPAELKGALEAIIYAADEPATLDQLVEATGAAREEVLAAIDEMIGACGADERGIEIRRVARGFRYSTKPRHHEVVRQFIKNLRPPVRLSMPALETLAVIAYRQPITLPEIQEVRGVNASGVIQTLLEKRLVATAGRKSVIGRPILYRTTKEFLSRFGLEDMNDLPSLKDFEQLAREALGPDSGLEFEPVAAPEGGAEAGESAPTPAPAENPEMTISSEPTAAAARKDENEPSEDESNQAPEGNLA
jgi:segregation and condensation protein B